MEAKVLLYDIETAYIETKEKRWGIWDDRPIQRDVVHDWYILCFAFKWLGSKRIQVVALPDFPSDYRRNHRDDKQVLEKLHELFSLADIVIAHNGNSFDQKKVQARMQVHHMMPPMPYAQIDTKLEMKRVAAHTSNKLMDLNRRLGLKHKLDAGGIKTWDGCMEKDYNRKAWNHMKKYNKGDIVALEELYLLERPWMKNHPAINVLTGRPTACKNCGGTRLNAGMKYRATNTNLYQYYRCMKCGAPNKHRLPEPKEEAMLYV